MNKTITKNKKNAWDFLQSFRARNIVEAIKTGYNPPEEFKKIYGLESDIMRDYYYLKKSCKASDLYEFIDKYIGDIMVYELNKSPPQYGNITKGKRHLSWLDCDGFIRYSMIYTKTINNKINKLSSRVLKRLYNPHTELGRNYALKNIEWAYE